MNIDSAVLVYFSPTNTTKTTLKSIAEGLGIPSIKEIDLTYSNANLNRVEYGGNQLFILGAPVYGGRVPMEAEKRFRLLKGNGNLAVVVVLYGNREYEDALLELKNISEDLGMQPVAAGAFIGEHSFSTEGTPIAVGRPDHNDLEKARSFGKRIMKKLASTPSMDMLESLKVPGNFPYKKRMDMSSISPITHEESCVKCGKCAEICPTGIVTVEEKVMTRAESCLLCCACVKACPTDSRVMTHPQIMEISQRLSSISSRKEPEIFS